MIRHCVFIRFRPEVSEAEKATIFAEISALKERLSGFLAIHVGANISPEAGMDKGYAEGFIVDFADAEARDAYLGDPEHQKTGRKIVAATDGGVQGVFVYDLEIPD
ncbi:Dabb family protein [Sinorhizobium sp. BJ1]|uniref:Dabb family protein n=1 Tax=Sinorhizobium sp. BJ1 TaxID=2035455 RepID=UPI000BE94036|nr:Dabb family protein [Sinorhizobium sp. BJ1]PDT83500.1 stress responsive protein [Sinorhizobium sp. BJ1]